MALAIDKLNHIMASENRKKLKSKKTSDKSAQTEFTFIKLKDDVIEKHGLPKLPCPVRVSVLERILTKGSIEFPVLADECIAYCHQNPDNQADYTDLLVRLCYLAGINFGQAGDDSKAQSYLSQAYMVDPNDIQVASNYALALSKGRKFDESLDIYEQILAFLQDGKRGFSPQVWIDAVKIHHMKGNFRRALELVEISINEAPQYFGEEAKAFAEELRHKIANG